MKCSSCSTMVLRKNMEVGVLRKNIFREIWRHTVNSLFKVHSLSKILTSFYHCVKRVRIQSYSGSHFSRIFPYSVQMLENPGRMRARITPNTDSFHAVHLTFFLTFQLFLHKPIPFIFLSMFLENLDYFRGSF